MKVKASKKKNNPKVSIGFLRTRDDYFLCGKLLKRNRDFDPDACFDFWHEGKKGFARILMNETNILMIFVPSPETPKDFPECRTGDRPIQGIVRRKWLNRKFYELISKIENCEKDAQESHEAQEALWEWKDNHCNAEDEFFEKHYANKSPKQSRSKASAEAKNDSLIKILEDKRSSFAFLGTNKVKRRLNKLAKTDKVAVAVRMALEVEDANISAKKAFGKYREKGYHHKERLLHELAEVFAESNWIYGVQKDGGHSTSHVIYFEIPGCEQVSWHCNFSDDFPKYPGKWDGKENATLSKLEVISLRLLTENCLLD